MSYVISSLKEELVLNIPQFYVEYKYTLNCTQVKSPLFTALAPVGSS